MAQAQIPNQCQSNRTSPSLQLYRQETPNWGNVECQKSLKLVLKWEIHNLLQRLSDVGEESVIVTANISDDSTSVLGSHFGEKFVVQSDLDALKHQFLRYCAVHCKRKSKKTYSPSKRKTADETRSLKRLRKSLHEYSQSPSMDSVSPLREMSNGEKEGSIESDISTAVINTLTTPIVPLSKLNSSRRKHTPKKVIASLPVSQSDSDTEDTNFTMDTIVKVEADDQDDDIYAETNTHYDEYKHDYFDTYKSMDKNDYFDGNTLKSGNLSDDSSGGPCTSFLMNEYRNIVGAGKDLLSGYPKSDYLLNRGRDTDSSLKNGPFSGFSNSLESDSDISVIDGLPGDNVSLPDMENFSYSPSMTVSNSYTSLEGDGKLKKTGPGLSKKGGPRASTGFKATYNEDPAETVLLDQSKKGVRQYQCPYCELMVRDRHDLKRHLRTHTKEKPYTCEMCGKKFTRKWDQENHIKKHQETVLREMYLAKEAELQVKQNLDTINKMTMKVKEQQAGLERTSLNITDDSRAKTDLNIGDYSALETKTDVNITDSSANVTDRIALSNGSVLSEEMNGHLLASPVKLEK